MIRALKKILPAIFCLTLVGCGAEGEPYQQRMTSASQSLIYLYRPYAVFGSQTVPLVTCGHETIELDAGGFYEFVDDGGTVSCSVAGDPAADLKFDAHVGERYFIREDVLVSGINTHVQLALMHANEGRDEIGYCRRQGIKH